MSINLEITFDFTGYAQIQIPDVLISFNDYFNEKLRNRKIPKSGHNPNNDDASPSNRLTQMHQ